MIEKIKKDITERSIKKNFTLLPQTGKSQHEFDYRFCKSELEGLKDYYFVVSKVMKYQGNSMVDYGYVVYVYDKNGNYFSLDMSMFESGYSYGIKFLININDNEYKEQSEVFKFRVI